MCALFGALAVLSALSAFLLGKWLKTRKEAGIYLDSIRTRDSCLNDVIDDTVAILKELLEMAATGNEEMFLVRYRLTRNRFLDPTNPRSILHNMDKIADCRYYGVLSDLKEHYSRLTDDDILFCSFICFDFNPSVIAMVYGFTSPQSYYNKRSRIRSRMGRNNESDHIQTYLRERIAILSSKDLH